MLSLGLWVFGSEVINATAVGLLAVSLMLALHVVPWKDVLAITAHGTRWSTWRLVVMANGLTRSGFIDWFANTMSTHLEGFSPNATALIVLVLVFYFAHYLFASLSAHRNHALPVILAVGKGIPGVPMEQLYPAGTVYRYHGLSDAVCNRSWGDYLRLWLCEIKRLLASWRNLRGDLHLYAAVGWLADSRHVELIRSPNAE